MKHTVQQGDTLWMLARSYYGDATQWPTIWHANSWIQDPSKYLIPGQILEIPLPLHLTKIDPDELSLVSTEAAITGLQLIEADLR